MVEDERGREKERYPVVPGAKIKVKEGSRVTAGKLLVEWDPFTTPILTEVSGTLAFRDIMDEVTIREQIDEVTGLVPAGHHRGPGGQAPAARVDQGSSGRGAERGRRARGDARSLHAAGRRALCS